MWFVKYQFIYYYVLIYFLWSRLNNLFLSAKYIVLIVPKSTPENLRRPVQNPFSRDLSLLFVYPRASLKTLKSQSVHFISTSKNNTIYKSLQGLQGHHEHTHIQTKTRLKTLMKKVFRGLQGLQHNIKLRKKYFCKVRIFMRFIESLLRKTDS